MPRPVDGRYRVGLGFPFPIGMLSVQVHVSPAGLTIPFVSNAPLPYYPPPIDLFGSPGGRTKVECDGAGHWHGYITLDNGTIVPLEGDCAQESP